MPSDAARRRLGNVWHSQAFDTEDGTKAGIVEYDAYNCNHCARFVILPNAAAKANRPLCHGCNAYTCGLPDCRLQCNPVDETIELAMRFPMDTIPLLRGPQGEVLFDKEKLLPFKSFRKGPREC